MKKLISESFELNFKIMKVLGWYQTGSSKWYTAYSFLLYFLLLISLLLLSLMDAIAEKNYDSMQIIYIAQSISYSSKLIPFLVNGERIANCISYLDDAYFNPRDANEEKIVDQAITVCKKMSSAFIIGVTSCEFCFIARAIFYEDYTLPIQIWLPYKVKTAATYFPTWLYIVMSTAYMGFSSSLIDPLIGGLAFHITTQFKVLKYRIQSNDSQHANARQIYNNFRKCVEFHNVILKFIDEYESCVSWTAFSQFLGTTLGLCCCCIELTMVPLASLDGVTYILFYWAIFWQVFFYCLFGSLLFHESDTLTTAVYMTRWYTYDTTTRKLLITMMEKAKRSRILRTQKVVDLSLETFTKMLRGSYSLIAVLK